jgi:predicted mannosyl-3-phosphoglycerate phosphatase (HAD superfamily)
VSRLVSANLDRLNGIRVVYTDLDGTMLGPRGSFLHAPDGSPSLEPASALLEAFAAGVDVVPTSGRALRGLQTDARILAMPNVIAEMGALLSYDFGQEVVRNFGETPEDDLPARVMERTGAVAALLRNFGDRLEHHTPWSGWRECTHLFRGLVDVEECNAFLAAHGFDWLLLHDNGRLHGAYLGLDAGNARAYHLQPRGVTKGLAVKLDRERRGIAREEAVAIGDAFADLELAAEAGTFVIVCDALEDDPALRAATETLDNVLVTDRAQNLGWTDVLRAISARA